MTPRYVGDFRDCSRCGASKCWPASFAKVTGAVCKTCRSLQAQEWERMATTSQHAHAAAARHAARDARQALVAAAATARDARRAMNGPAGPSLFDATLAACAAAWGVPYARWSRDQHAQHTALIRRQLGLVA